MKADCNHGVSAPSEDQEKINYWVATCTDPEGTDPEDAVDLTDGIDVRLGVKGDKRSLSAFHSSRDTECLNAAGGYARACEVQCVLTGIRGPLVILHGLFSISLCSEVYAVAGLGQGWWNDCFYLTCNNKWYPPSDKPVYPYLVQGRAELRLLGRLRGANDDKSQSSHLNQDNPARPNSPASTAAENRHTTQALRNTNTTMLTEITVQPPRRGARSCVMRAAEVRSEEPHLGRIIYALGNLPAADRDDWKKLLHDFHRDEDVQQKVDQYLRAAHKHLEWATADAYSHGVCYRVKQLITESTRFGYYSGAITRSAPHSNHVLALGNFGGSSCPLVLDGCPERNATRDAGRLVLMQMFPHSCTLNCKVAIIETIPGLELHVIEALVDIPVGAYPTFNYDALATETEKRRGKSFWRWFQPFVPKDERAGGVCRESNAFAQAHRVDARTDSGVMSGS